MSERDGKLMNALVSCVTSSLMSLTIKGFILRILLYFQYLGRAYFSLFIFLLTFLFFHVFCNAFFFFFPRSQRSLECDHYRLVCLLRLLIHISLSTSSLFSSLFSIYPCILRRASFPQFLKGNQNIVFIGWCVFFGSCSIFLLVFSFFSFRCYPVRFQSESGGGTTVLYYRVKRQSSSPAPRVGPPCKAQQTGWAAGRQLSAGLVPPRTD